MSKPVIGFIGLGLMGGNMVENLQKRGFKVIVMDLNQDAVDAVLARGNATQASSPKELAEKSDIVQFCLTTSAVVEKIVYADDGILAGIKEGSVLIDFGTSIPASTKKIGADLAKKGVGMIAARQRMPRTACSTSWLQGIKRLLINMSQCSMSRAKMSFIWALLGRVTRLS